MKVTKYRLMGQAKINSINSSRRGKEKFYDRPERRKNFYIEFIEKHFYGSFRLRLQFSIPSVHVRKTFTSREQNGLKALTSDFGNRKIQSCVKHKAESY